jgi:hypothetical protein
MYNFIITILALALCIGICGLILFLIRLIFDKKVRDKSYLLKSSYIYTAVFFPCNKLLGFITSLFLKDISTTVSLGVQVLIWLVSGYISYKVGEKALFKLSTRSKTTSSVFETVKHKIPQWIIDDCEERKGNLFELQKYLLDMVNRKEISRYDYDELYKGYCEEKEKSLKQ